MARIYIAKTAVAGSATAVAITAYSSTMAPQKLSDDVTLTGSYADLSSSTMLGAFDGTPTTNLQGKNIDRIVIKDTLANVITNAAKIKALQLKLLADAVDYQVPALVVAITKADFSAMTTSGVGTANQYQTLLNNCIGGASGGNAKLFIMDTGANINAALGSVHNQASIDAIKAKGVIGFIATDATAITVNALEASNLVFKAGPVFPKITLADTASTLFDTDMSDGNQALIGVNGDGTFEYSNAVSRSYFTEFKVTSGMVTLNTSIAQMLSPTVTITAATGAVINYNVADTIANLQTLTVDQLKKIAQFDVTRGGTSVDWWNQTLTTDTAHMVELVRIANASANGLWIKSIVIQEKAADLTTKLFAPAAGTATVGLLAALQDGTSKLGMITIDASDNGKVELTLAQANSLLRPWAAPETSGLRSVAFDKADTIVVKATASQVNDLMYNQPWALDDFRRANVDSLKLVTDANGTNTVEMQLWQARQFLERGISFDTSTAGTAIKIDAYQWDLQSLTKSVMQKLVAAGMGTITLQDQAPTICLSAATAANLASVTGIKLVTVAYDWGDGPVTPKVQLIDSGANIGTLTVDQVANLTSLGITTIDSTNNAVAVSMSVALKMQEKGIKFAADDTSVTVLVSKADLAKSTFATDIAKINAANKISPNAPAITASYSALELKNLVVADITALGTKGIGWIDNAGSGTVALSVAQAKELAKQKIGSKDILKIQDSADNIKNLVAADLITLLKDPGTGNFHGFKTIVTDGGLPFSKTLAEMKTLRDGLEASATGLFATFAKAVNLEATLTAATATAAGVGDTITLLRANNAPLTVTLTDTATNLKALTVQQLLGLENKVDTIVVSDANDLQVTVAQMGELMNFDLVAGNGKSIVLADYGANIANMKDFQIGAYAAAGVTKIDALDNLLILTAAKAHKFAISGVAFTDADTVNVKDKALGLGALEATDFALMKSLGIDGIQASEKTKMDLTKVNALKASGLTVTGALVLADDSFDILANLKAADMADLRRISVKEIAATDMMPLNFNGARVDAMIATGIKFAQGTEGWLINGADKLTALKVADIAHLTTANVHGISLDNDHQMPPAGVTAVLGFDVVKAMLQADMVVGDGFYLGVTADQLATFADDVTPGDLTTLGIRSAAVFDTDANLASLLADPDLGTTLGGVAYLSATDGSFSATLAQAQVMEANALRAVGPGSIALSVTEYDLNTNVSGNVQNFANLGFNTVQIQLDADVTSASISAQLASELVQAGMAVTANNSGFELSVFGTYSDLMSLANDLQMQADMGQPVSLNIASVSVIDDQDGVVDHLVFDNPDDAFAFANSGLKLDDAISVSLRMSPMDFTDVSGQPGFADNVKLLASAGVDSIEIAPDADPATDDNVYLTVAKARMLINNGVKLTTYVDEWNPDAPESQIILRDAGASVAKLTSGQLAAIHEMGVTEVDLLNDAIAMTAARAKTFGQVGLSFSDGDEAVVRDSEINLKNLDATKLKYIGAANFDQIDSLSDHLDVNVSQARAIMDARLSINGDDDVTLLDNGANMAAGFRTLAAGLTRLGVDAIDVTDDAVTLSAETYLKVQASGIRFAAGDVLTVKDDASALSHLSTAKLDALTSFGVKNYVVATSGNTVDAISATTLAALAQAGATVTREAASVPVKILIDSDTADTVLPDDFGAIITKYGASTSLGVSQVTTGADARVSLAQYEALKAGGLLTGLAAGSLTIADSAYALKSLLGSYTVDGVAQALPAEIGGLMVVDTYANLQDQTELTNLNNSAIEHGLFLDGAIRDTAENILNVNINDLQNMPWMFGWYMNGTHGIKELRVTDASVTISSDFLAHMNWGWGMKFAGPADVKLQADAWQLMWDPQFTDPWQINRLTNAGIDKIVPMSNGQPTPLTVVAHADGMDPNDPDTFAAEISLKTYAVLTSAGLQFSPDVTFDFKYINAWDYAGEMDGTPLIDGFDAFGTFFANDTLAYYGNSKFNIDFSVADGADQSSGDATIVGFENLNASAATNDVTVTVGQHTDNVTTGYGNDQVILKNLDHDMGMINVNTNTGNDTVVVQGAGGNGAQVMLGLGADTVNLTAANLHGWWGSFDGGMGVDGFVINKWVGGELNLDQAMVNIDLAVVMDMPDSLGSLNSFESVNASAVTTSMDVVAKSQMMDMERMFNVDGKNISDYAYILTGSGNDNIYLSGVSYRVATGAGADTVTIGSSMMNESAGQRIDLGAADGAADTIIYEAGLNQLIARTDVYIPDPNMGGGAMETYGYDYFLANIPTDRIRNFESGKDKIMFGQMATDLALGHYDQDTGEYYLKSVTNTAIDFTWNLDTYDDVAFVDVKSGSNFALLTEASIVDALQGLGVSFEGNGNMSGGIVAVRGTDASGQLLTELFMLVDADGDGSVFNATDHTFNKVHYPQDPDPEGSLPEVVKLADIFGTHLQSGDLGILVTP